MIFFVYILLRSSIALRSKFSFFATTRSYTVEPSVLITTREIFRLSLGSSW